MPMKKPASVSEQEFEWQRGFRSPEGPLLKNLEKGYGVTFKCRWTHYQYEGRSDRCGGESYFRMIAKRINWHFKIKHGTNTITVFRDA